MIVIYTHRQTTQQDGVNEMNDIIDAANYIKSIDATQIEKTQAICGLISSEFTPNKFESVQEYFNSVSKIISAMFKHDVFSNSQECKNEVMNLIVSCGLKASLSIEESFKLVNVDLIEIYNELKK